jgi:hypothetical protein
MVQNVGLLTLPLNANFGGIIQAVALARWLEGQGKRVTLLDRRRPVSTVQGLLLPVLEAIPFQNIRGVPQRELARKLHRPFINANFAKRTPVLRSPADMARAAKEAGLEAVIVGSDQVWRPDYLHKDAVQDFFLGFDGDFRRISYAASFGVGQWNFPEMVPDTTRNLARFDAVSVRERSGQEICRETLGRGDAVHVLDPTLLVDPALHADIAAEAGQGAGQGGKTAFCYLLDKPALRAAALQALGPGYTERAFTLADSDSVTLPHWVAAFRDADFVVTDSYHGTIFSIVFEKPFIAIANVARGADRFTSLLGLEDRLIDADAPDAAARSGELVATPVDFAAVGEKLAAERARSAAFLTEALA